MKFEFNRKEYETKFLTPGGYIGKIKAVNVVGETVSVYFDIAEGDLKDTFTKEYQKNGGGAQFDASKWSKKGAVNFNFQYNGAKFAFAKLLDALEDSNQAFKWNNETNDLKGKLIGVVYRKNTYEDKWGDLKEGTDYPEFISTKAIASNNFSIEPKGSKTTKPTEQAKTTESNFDFGLDDIQFD